jgi:aryl-alcohol dehydrogenase-like predicted oxidoreductase
MHANNNDAKASNPVTSGPLGTVRLGRSNLVGSKITLGTMTFGEQVNEADSHAIMDRALERGVTIFDTAEMYPVPPEAKHYADTERFMGRWFAKHPSKRSQVVLATKIAGPARGMDWVRGGKGDLTPDDFVQACDASLKRLQTDVIDLYQIHWPNRNTPMFGTPYFDPSKDRECMTVLAQLEALQKLIKAGKVRDIGLSNETPWGVMDFVRVAEQHGLPRIATVQNAYALTNRVPDNGLDEVMHHLGVGLLAYSPLAFGALTGKYDEGGLDDPKQTGRIARYERFRTNRWGRKEALMVAAHYNTLARQQGLTPTCMALAWCYHNWRVASTIIGVTTLAQLDECLDAYNTKLSPELLGQIDALRARFRDPAQ